MRRRILVLAVALASAAAVSAGVMNGVRPFEAASAQSPTAAMPTEAQAALDRILSQSEPGARVTKLPDGGFAVQGTRTPRSAAVFEEMERARRAGPATVVCLGGPRVTCTAVATSAADAMLRSGETLYARGVHGGITDAMVNGEQPIFGADELVCGDPVGAAAAMACVRAGDAVPHLARGETTIATYLPVQGSADGTASMQAPHPSVPATRDR